MSGEQNAAVVERLIVEGFGQGNLAVVDEILDEACLEHQPGIEPANREGVKQAIHFLHMAFPDFRVAVQHVTTDADMVWIHFQASGTNSGPFGHQPPTGKSMTIDVIDLARVRDGRIVEHWGVADRFSQLQQLGMLPMQRQPAS